MNILITGITGFSGSHLAEYLSKKRGKIYGTVRGRCRQTGFIDHIKNKLTLLECDLTDPNAVISTINDAQPDAIYHLAAQSFVPTSWRSPQETLTTNVLGTLNILEAVRKSKFNPKILIAGSSEEYGLVKEGESPIKETNSLRPLSPYGVSKVAQDLLGFQYFQSYGLKVIRMRSFNLMGPRSGEKIFTASFAKQIAKIMDGETPEMKVGNLEAIRDLNDVRDIVRGYKMAVDKCNIGEVYNICSGDGHRVKEVLDILLEYSGMDILIHKDETLMRPSDVPILIGDSTKFREKTGWKQNFSLEQSLLDVLNYWRN